MLALTQAAKTTSDAHQSIVLSRNPSTRDACVPLVLLDQCALLMDHRRSTAYVLATMPCALSEVLLGIPHSFL